MKLVRKEKAVVGVAADAVVIAAVTVVAAVDAVAADAAATAVGVAGAAVIGVATAADATVRFSSVRFLPNFASAENSHIEWAQGICADWAALRLRRSPSVLGQPSPFVAGAE
jgi:hypothetical protein